MVERPLLGVTVDAVYADDDRVCVRGQDRGEQASGTMMSMVAADGPHYGDNVKLMGPGAYRLKLLIASPETASSHAMFGRHVDKETGVAAWFEPFEVSYEFVFAGTGKKGGY